MPKVQFIDLTWMLGNTNTLTPKCICSIVQFMFIPTQKNYFVLVAMQSTI